MNSNEKKQNTSIYERKGKAGGKRMLQDQTSSVIAALAGDSHPNLAAEQRQRREIAPQSRGMLLWEWIQREHRLLGGVDGGSEGTSGDSSVAPTEVRKRRWLLDSTRLSEALAEASQTWARGKQHDYGGDNRWLFGGVSLRPTIIVEETNREDLPPNGAAKFGSRDAAECCTSRSFSVHIENGIDAEQQREVSSKSSRMDMEQKEQEHLSKRERSVLFFLGSAMYEIFSGMPLDMSTKITRYGGNETGLTTDDSASNTCNDESHSRSSVRNTTEDPPIKRASRQNISANGCMARCGYSPLTDFGLPSSISVIVSSLLDGGAGFDACTPVYETVSELINDLRVLRDHPDRFMFAASSDPTEALLLSSRSPGLPLLGRLYGREEHLHSLRAVFDSFVEGLPGGGSSVGQAVLLSGGSGTGKSSLAQWLQSPVNAVGGLFLTGKFDQTQKCAPLSTICGAFDEFCNLVLAGGSPDDAENIRNAISSAVGPDIKLLTDIIPQLSTLLAGAQYTRSSMTETHVEGKQARNRLKFFFRKFVQSICSPSRPLVLFLDDLQWADEESLDLIAFLLADVENSCLLLIGCYRDNEIGPDSPLSVWLQGIGKAGVEVTQIHLDNVRREDVNAMVSDVLRLPPCPVRSLSDGVYRKTQGNLFFVVQFMRSLLDEGLLTFSLVSRRWEWDIFAINSKDIVSDVLELLVRKMLKMPDTALQALQVASCFGHQCDESTLRLLDRSGSGQFRFQNLADALNVTVDEGLMFKIGPQYRFSHDQIQKVAYSLTSQAEMNALHLSLGRAILQASSEAEIDTVIFLAVDQLDRGQDLVTDDNERLQIVRLNLRAGRKAISSAGFLPASVFLQEGIRSLRINDWESNYDLCLDIYSTCAETLFALANYDTVNTMANVIFAFGKCLYDKCRAYYTLVCMLHAQGKNKDAVVTSLNVLSQLGVSFPVEINGGVVEDSLLATMDALEGTTMDSIKRKEAMHERDKVIAMKFLNAISLFVHHWDRKISVLVTFRMVELSLEYGVCKESALGFAAFASFLCTRGDLKNGQQFANLAICLLQRFKAKECLPCVYSVVHGFVSQFHEPLQAGLVTHHSGYEVGMSCGDVMWAMMNAVQYISKSIQSGCKLDELVGQIRVYLQQMKEYNLHNVLLSARLRLQFVLNLIKSQGDPTVMTGEAMNQEEFTVTAIQKQTWAVLRNMYCFRVYLAYMFGRYQLAAELIEKVQELHASYPGLKVKSGFVLYLESFSFPLVAVAVMEQSSKDCKWKKLAKTLMCQLKAWAETCPWNFQHQYDLLSAEMAFREGNIETAAVAFENAIRNAAGHRFVNDQAIACERAAIFSSAIGNKHTAADYYKQAYDLYMQWGARQKAGDIMQNLSDIQ